MSSMNHKPKKHNGLIPMGVGGVNYREKNVLVLLILFYVVHTYERNTWELRHLSMPKGKTFIFYGLPLRIKSGGMALQ